MAHARKGVNKSSLSRFQQNKTRMMVRVMFLAVVPLQCGFALLSTPSAVSRRTNRKNNPFSIGLSSPTFPARLSTLFLSESTGADKEQVDKTFNAVDTDGSGTIDLEEFCNHLMPVGYSMDVIRESFSQMDTNQNGEISRIEFQHAILNHLAVEQDESDVCPKGYFLNSVQQTCQPLGPIGRLSQKLETTGPFRQVYKRITNLFGQKQKIKELGVSFMLAYSVISNLSGAISFSVAWYISCKRTGLSPLVPGQWKSLLSSYGMIYGLIQVLKPFRIAAAIAMSKLSAEYLTMTQERLNCSRSVAIGCQFITGQIMMVICAFLGVWIVSTVTGVPIRG